MREGRKAVVSVKQTHMDLWNKSPVVWHWHQLDGCFESETGRGGHVTVTAFDGQHWLNFEEKDGSFRYNVPQTNVCFSAAFMFFPPTPPPEWFSSALQASVWLYEIRLFRNWRHVGQGAA